MQLRTTLGIIIGASALCVSPVSAFADTVLTPSAPSATIGALSPADTVGVGTNVSFNVMPSGFSSPSYKVVDSFGGGVSSINIDGYGFFNWTPNNSDIGTHTITITVSDSSGSTANVSQTITVTAPTVTISALSPGGTVKMGSPVSFTLGSTGFISAQYTLADSFGYSTISSGNLTGNIFTWTPIYQDVGTHILTATARDYLGHTATVQQTITVIGYAALHIASIKPEQTVHVGEQEVIVASTTGFVSPTFTVTDGFTSSLGTSTLTIDQSGRVTWTPNSNDIGGHNLTISATDSTGNNQKAYVTLTVVPAVNTPYVAPVVPASTTTSPTVIKTAALSYTFKSFLGVGSSGKDVIALQQLLAQLGFLKVEPSGYFGSMTKTALMAYQNAHGISPLGYAGPATRASLSLGK